MATKKTEMKKNMNDKFNTGEEIRQREYSNEMEKNTLDIFIVVEWYEKNILSHSYFFPVSYQIFNLLNKIHYYYYYYLINRERRKTEETNIVNGK